MAPVETAPLLKKTMLYVAAMVGSCVVIVGVLSILAVTIIGKATQPADSASSPALVPGDPLDRSAKAPNPGAVQAKPIVPRTNPI